MRKVSTLAGTCGVLLLTAATALAAPCGPGQQATANNKSSNVDPSATSNVTPGAKAESPGTVGAMQNVGAPDNKGTGGSTKDGKMASNKDDNC